MSGKRLGEAALLALFAVAVILPLCTIAIWVFAERWAWPDLLPQVFSLRAVASVFHRGGELARVFASGVLISLAVAVLAVVIGIMTARALSLYRFRGRSLASFLTLLPFLVPATVFAMGIHSLFLRVGLGSTVAGVIIVHLIYSLPYTVRMLEEASGAVGLSYEEQARVLGASPWQAFRRTTLPNLTPAILSAFSMAYIVSFSQYFLTLLIGGGRVKTFTIVMVPYLQSGERNLAAVYSLIFLGITLLIFAFFEWVVGRLTRARDVEFYN